MIGKVLVAAPVHRVIIDGLTEAGYECIVNEKIEQEAAIKMAAECTGIVTSTRLQINKELIDNAPGLKWVGRMGSGMEVIDVPYAEQKGISCYSSPEGNSNAVGEHALGMLLSLNKKIVISNAEVKTGQWKRTQNRGVELEGKTVGIIGFGNTGRAFARKLQGFDVKILAYDKLTPENVPEYVQVCENLNIIYDKADIISFHVPLQKDTFFYMDEQFINSMKKPFILVNTSRGKVIDTDDVLKGINEGKISGVCLDVWEEEPISKMSERVRNNLEKMVMLPNVIITPHIAGYSHEALYKMSKILLDRIVTK